ncbi:MAG: tetratricopeptide repeat protein [Okeania sp. SIO2G4]|uniref:tetratricopeptide repeat protein n=1 Tax=unclassified Okeania TaxID=2634635 RepID=UPI0013B6F7B1|nr:MULTISPECIES: tetratricopeptide repeat protein [unclassified Okeania]NEP03727.1 tetratricopeptide repeat protein [Okeania sp. SIO4D6]NEP38074.1 tetratricopeptide repeat protein [Okeania sp. SIO2H7]NEP74682.1 tetratricopeptide repeat protein [Okeania sp. SIO2G5]NEP95467.1 tetratricopeptide repeat protein [Okeania sp. SIO2F5]NEQ93542.1 tetratricopeptide repeat protein [Okeania sp. SIO2G4]
MEKNQAAKTHVKEGNRLKRNGQFESAIASYKKAIEINPRFSWSYFYLGEALINLKRLNEAIEVYHQAITLNPSSALFYCRLGDALTDNGQIDEAQKYYQWIVWR